MTTSRGPDTSSLILKVDLQLDVLEYDLMQLELGKTKQFGCDDFDRSCIYHDQ
jgi:hypothetical protein